MTRATTTSSTKTTPKKIHLTTQQGPSGTALVVTSSSFYGRSVVTMTHDEFYTFRLLMLHLSQIMNGYDGLKFLKKISPIKDTLLYIYSFLYSNTAIVRLVAPKITNEHDQLEAVSSALCATAPVPDRRDYSTSSLYFLNYSIDIKLGALLSAAHDANIDALKHIIEKTNPENRSRLLSTPEGESYSETRLDTAFKVALVTGDEEMAGEIAQYLDPAEKARQFKNVFRPDFTAFFKQQEQEAQSLFKGLVAAFNSATQTEMRNALNHVSNADGTTSALQQKIAEFKTKLEDYVAKTRPLHNDFILAKAYEIYDKNWSLWTDDQLCLFSQPVIGLIQETYLETSKKRSMDIAEGICNRAQNIDKDMPARRSLLLAGSTADIRSVVDLGSRCCIDIFGRRGCVGARRLVQAVRVLGVAFSMESLAESGSFAFIKIVSSKNIGLGKFMQPAKSPHQSRTGCAMM
ncbi:MAG: hypothetical protein A3I77_00550 [Gammaproteobacteria bacterium RIFCSPLOWO2_02_FULL_42_14]|nr:MAG: hypothetical protein A3B71_08635 [Gammaproteobacteria bacterium RIFCSPHIGHO2_02_FULL_42_43]OGT29287.1 MAG: hypothetical protein A2624_04600 [Gammaproteobacteria bacterium RIFCSPHIGHO2_01_FULL_42_8]OGT50773.1 MAG: hypothetical protein A3E54_00830 [Gammaproteobacteria bacterium RIFCSPHIGHO2_12_FULL_41_25]OGT61758.1 MAG: hypothetical protein A3I77_00550 [Gammaproteobacteria bacterium RIFCSPLOWO2_02_FULL_42_14]OGT85502.1 MAG: hypothetical protein A3G86_06740 [Gammaproteobacteria bacterium R